MAHAPAVQQQGMSLEEYAALADRGVLEEAHVELLESQVVSMTPPSYEHDELVRELTARLAPAGRDLRVQLTLRLPPNSMPQPDVALAPRVPKGTTPTVRLAIEIVVTQWLAAQRKLPIYAQADVEEYWIVHEPKRCVHVYDQPAGRAYGRERVLTGDDVLTPPGTDIRFTVAELFAFRDED